MCTAVDPAPVGGMTEYNNPPPAVPPRSDPLLRPCALLWLATSRGATATPAREEGQRGEGGVVRRVGAGAGAGGTAATPLPTETRIAVPAWRVAAAAAERWIRKKREGGLFASCARTRWNISPWASAITPDGERTGQLDAGSGMG